MLQYRSREPHACMHSNRKGLSPLEWPIDQGVVRALGVSLPSRAVSLELGLIILNLFQALPKTDPAFPPQTISVIRAPSSDAERRAFPSGDAAQLCSMAPWPHGPSSRAARPGARRSHMASA